MTASVLPMGSADSASATATAGDTTTGPKGEKVKGMTLFGMSWRIAGYVALTAALAAAAFYGIPVALAYIGALGLGETALLAVQVAFALLVSGIAVVSGWFVGKGITRTILERQLSKLLAE